MGTEMEILNAHAGINTIKQKKNVKNSVIIKCNISDRIWVKGLIYEPTSLKPLKTPEQYPLNHHFPDMYV